MVQTPTPRTQRSDDVTQPNTKQDDIERAIYRCENFAEFLELVAEICNEKASHVQNKMDILLAEIWEKRAKLIGEVSELVEFEVRTGTTVLEIAGERIRDKYFVPIESGKAPTIANQEDETDDEPLPGVSR